jgi:hypothetical protein
VDGPDQGLMMEPKAGNNGHGPGVPDTAGGRPDAAVSPSAPDRRADPLEPMAQLFRDLRALPAGLSGREAARRLEVSVPNEPARRGGQRWPGDLATQFTPPLAVLLTVARRAGPG